MIIGDHAVLWTRAAQRNAVDRPLRLGYSPWIKSLIPTMLLPDCFVRCRSGGLGENTCRRR
jgi:hypothetical protein